MLSKDLEKREKNDNEEDAFLSEDGEDEEDKRQRDEYVDRQRDLMDRYLEDDFSEDGEDERPTEYNVNTAGEVI